MSKMVDEEIRSLLRFGDAAGACVAAPDHRLRVALRRRLGEEGMVVSPVRGLYALRSEWEELGPSERSLSIMRGLQRLHPGWVFCGPSAALAFGADVSYGAQRPFHVMAPGGSWPAKTALLHYHGIALDAYAGIKENPVERSGIVVTPLARTVLDSLRWLDFREGMVVADFALRGREGKKDSLLRYLESRRGTCVGVDQASFTLERADGRAESGGESIARAVMMEQGFMLPALQVEIPDPLTPGSVFRADFVWLRADGRVIVGECDGKKKLFDKAMTRGKTPEEVLLGQRSREGLLTAYDVSVMRFTYEEAASVTGLVRKLELYGVPRADSPLARTGGECSIDWSKMLRR